MYLVMFIVMSGQSCIIIIVVIYEQTNKHLKQERTRMGSDSNR